MSVLIKESNNYFSSIRPLNLDFDIATEHLQASIVRSRVVDIFEEFMLESLNVTNWFDKTVNVEAVRATLLLKQIWPDAKFVFTYRTAVESVPSAIDQFGDNIEFESACLHWASCMMAWDEVRPHVVNQSFELDHGHLLTDKSPEIVADLATFLELDDTERAKFTAFYAAEIDAWLPTRKRYAVDSERTAKSTWKENFLFNSCQRMMLKFGFWSQEYIEELRRGVHSDILLEYTVSNVKAERFNLEKKEDYCEIPGGFMLHPTRKERPATVIYRSVQLNGHAWFKVKITSANSRAVSPIRFQIVITDTNSAEIIGTMSAVLNPSESLPLEIHIPDVARTALIDISFTTECTDLSNSNYYCWAHWYSPRLTFEDYV